MDGSLREFRLSIEEQKGHESTLPSEPQNIDDPEVPVLGLVPQQEHAQRAAQAAEEAGRQEERLLLDAPLARLGPLLVDGHQREGQDVHQVALGVVGKSISGIYLDQIVHQQHLDCVVKIDLFQRILLKKQSHYRDMP